MPQTLEVKGKSGKVYEFPIPDGADMGAFQQKIVQFMSERGETNAPARPPAMAAQPPAQWDAGNTPVNPMAPGLERRPSFTGNLKDFVGGVVGKLRGNAGPSARDAYTAKAQEAAAPRQESGRESVVRKAGGRPKPPLQMGDPDLLKRLVEEARAEEARKLQKEMADREAEAQRQLAISQQEDVVNPNPEGSTFQVPTDATSARTIMRQNMEPTAGLEKSLGALATGLLAPGATLSLTPDQKDAVLQGIGNAIPRAAAAALVSNPSSLAGAILEMGGWSAFGGVPETPEEWAMVGTGMAALHQAGRLGKFLFPLTKGVKPANAARAVARELRNAEPKTADFTPKADPNYVSGEAPKLTEMGAKGFAGSPLANVQSRAVKDDVFYHGTGNTDSVRKGLTYDFVGGGNDQYGPGFYFTDSIDTAKGYTTRRLDGNVKPGGEGNPGVIEARLNLKNPIRLDAETSFNVEHWPSLGRSDARRLIETLTKDLDSDALANWGDVSYEGRQKVINFMVDLYADNSPATLLYDLNREGVSLERGLREYSKLSGHDGVVITFKNGERHAVAWFPEQVEILPPKGADNPASAKAEIGGSTPPASTEPPVSAQNVKPEASKRGIVHGVAVDEPGVFWHGSASGDLRGGAQGLHVGTHKAATEALGARIGYPASGEWDGTREYGKTLLAGRKTLAARGIHETGFNAGGPDYKLPENDFYAKDYTSARGIISGNLPVPDTAKPNVEPVRITGPMTNTTATPIGDFQAGGRMQGQLRKGNAKKGYFYKNVGEDAGSISAVLPGGSHVERISSPTSVPKASVETPKPKTPPKGEQNADTLRVTVNGRTFDLEGEAKAAWLEEEKLHNARMARLKEQGAGPGDMKTAGMVHSARQREITGSLAPKEEANAFKKLKGNYIGKAVETPDGPGTVKGTAFGKIRVERADGTVASYLPEDLTAAKGAEDMSLPKGVSEVKAEPAPKVQASTRPSEALKGEKGKTESPVSPMQTTVHRGLAADGASRGDGMGKGTYVTGHEPLAKLYDEGGGIQSYDIAKGARILDSRSQEYKDIFRATYDPKADNGRAISVEAKRRGYQAVAEVADDGTIAQMVVFDDSILKPKPEPPKAGGISHEKIGQVRKDFGWEPTSKTTKTDAELAEGAKRYEGLEDQIAQSVMDDPKRVLKDEESLALGVRLQNLRKAMDKAKAAGDHEGYALLNEKALGIADALDKSGSAAGRALRARRFVVDSYDSFWLESGSRKANLGEAASGKRATEQAQIAAQLDSANKELAAQLEKARKEIELLTRTRTPRTGRATPAVRRTRALEALDKLGIQTAPRDTDPILGKLGQAPPQGKQSGFVAMPDVSSVQDKVKRNVMALIRSYGDDGAKNWDDIMTRLKQDLPGISEQEALFLVHEPYSKATADVYLARSNARKFMSGVQRDAEQRLKPLVVKVLDNALDFVSTTQRSMQTTLDNSLALIQGKGVLFYKPGTWFKAVGKSLKAGFRKDPIAYAEREMSKLEAHPLYAEFKQAGVEFSDLHGKYAAQEEALAGKLEDYVPGLTHSKAMATVLGNEMRFDTMRKLAAAYNGPAHLRGKYLEDMARMVNVLTGKAQGELAKSLASRQGGLVFYAGRWTLSKWQQATGYAFWKATKVGKVQVAKMYGTQLAAVSATVAAAQAFGWKVDLDPRSTGFGNAVSPDGTWEFDMFRSQGEPVRVIAQLLWGRISNAGNYKSPTEFGAYKPSDYLGDKGSPLLRTIEMLRTGETWDMATGERRTVKASDFWTAYIPLSIQENIRTMSDPRIGTAKGAGLIPLSFFGGNIGPAPKRKSDAKKAPPMSLLPPGMQKIIDGK